VAAAIGVLLGIATGALLRRTRIRISGGFEL
jgi:hypothetical protein